MARRPASEKDWIIAAVDSTVESFVFQLSPLGNVEARRMFGGHGIFEEDTMFAIVHRGRTYLKVDAALRDALERLGSEPFVVRPGRVLKSYYDVPAEALDDTQVLLRWARRSLAAARARHATQPTGADPESILEGKPKKIRGISESLRNLVRQTVPHATERGYPGWKLIGYRAPQYFCFIAPQEDEVRLGFERGTSLADPHGLLQGTGKQVRYVPIKSQRFAKARLRQLIEQAAALGASKKR